MLKTEELKTLANVSGPCLTIFQPLRDTFSQVTKTDTRLIAAAQEADALLMARGMDAADRERFLRPILKLARNTDWSTHTGSIVVFRAPGYTQATFWPDALDASVTLAEEFHILPLIAGIATQRDYWVLALSINHIRLLRGTAKGFTEMELPDSLPRNLNASTGLDIPDRDREARSAAGSNTGSMHAVRFGNETENENQNRHLRDFFKMIDRAIHPILSADHGHDPLVIVAVPRELALYRTVNTWPHLLAQDIHGSPDTFTEDRLHRAAVHIVTEAQKNNHLDADIETAAGRGLLLTDLNDIRAAAEAGQIDRLLLAADMSIHDPVLLNATALEVVRHSGTLVTVAAPVTRAILRYRVPEALTA